jgi:2-haloacid dehalogenase
MDRRTIFVFFDLGETLVDLKALVRCIAQRIGAEYPGIAGAADETARSWITRTSNSLPRQEKAAFVREIDVAAAVLRDLLVAKGISISGKKAETTLRRAWDDFEEQVEFCPGVSRAWLQGLFGLAAGLGIVTDGDSTNVERLVKRLQLDDFFAAIITSESVRAYKPNPRIYKAALLALGAEAHNSLFVSDTPLDLRGAAAVGMRTAFMPRGLLSEPEDLPSGSLRLSSPRDLDAILRELST